MDEAMDEAMEATLAGRPHGRNWRRTEWGDWRAEADGGRLAGVLSDEAGAWVARVYRHETGPSPAPDPEEAHGPTVFELEDLDLALDYVESNLGW
jgi:hypothetical protein